MRCCHPNGCCCCCYLGCFYKTRPSCCSSNAHTVLSPMAAPTYIRSLSFSAGPHSSSSWASALSTAYNNPSSLTPPALPSNNHLIYTHHLQSFNSHHDRNYTQHLHLNGDRDFSRERIYSTAPSSGAGGMRKTPPGLTGTGAPPTHGRRRSASIRMAPASYIKFDPFADEPLVPNTTTTMASSVTTPLTSSTQANQRAGAGATPASAAAGPYTIQIPAAGPTEIQRYGGGGSPSAAARRMAFAQTPAAQGSLVLGSPQQGRVNGGMGARTSSNGQGAPARLISTSRTSPPPSRAASPSPRQSSPASRASSPAPLASGPGALGGPNVSKLVAGILLNRVHAVGKPMRRRISNPGKEYVRSCLSSVVSCEA